jgi:glycogen debranching enzyme
VRKPARVAGWLLVALSAGAGAAAEPRLGFSVREGLNTNAFVRVGEVAAHLVLRSGTDPRLLIAFPAGDSGVAVWFEHPSRPVTWHLLTSPMPTYGRDGRGRALTGIVAEASLDSVDVEIRHAVLSSVRVLRDYERLRRLPRELEAPLVARGQTLTWSRDRLDGAAGYRLAIEITSGHIVGDHLRADADGRLRLRVTGLTGEPPLSPLAGDALLNGRAAADPRARETLGFLAYREKLLAGSWRFNTYFGRDTLMSMRLLLPALAAPATEDAVSSVLERLSPQGEVAHEEDIGERAVLDHLERDHTRSAAPVYDYKMIDEDFLLASVVSAWLLEPGNRRAHARVWARAFLAAGIVTADGRRSTRGAALVRNLRYALERATGFATHPVARNLVELKPGFTAGDWRDSEWGLGGGRYPYDVNAVLIPAALEAISRLDASGVLAPYLAPDDRALVDRASEMAATWRGKAPPLFEVTVPHAAAVRAIAAYVAAQAIPVNTALAALGGSAVRFHALALDAAGSAIPVMHSDEGFALLFSEPDAASVDGMVQVLMRPFPAGLMTGVGMVVANPVFSAPSVQARFSRNAYHGTVVWSWQQALFAAGLEHQLERNDLPPSVRTHLLEAQRALWSAIEATRSMNNSELWSWTLRNGKYEVVPFGAAAADVDESNAAQLWSTVYLAVRPPRNDP